MLISSCPTTPETRRVPLSYQQSGLTIEDPYQALETDTPEREQWIQNQTDRTRCHLDSDPRRGQIKQRLLELFVSKESDYKSALQKGDGFELQWSKTKEQYAYVLTRFLPGQQKGTPVLDPNSWPKGQTIAAMTVSPDNRYVAYGRVTNGMDVGKLEILDLKTGELVKSIDGMRTTSVPTWAHTDDKLYFSLKTGEKGFLGYDISEDALTKRGTGNLAYDGEVVERNGSLLYTAQSAVYGSEKLVYVGPDGKEVSPSIPEGETSFATSGGNVFVRTNAEAPNGRIFRVQMDKVEDGQPKIDEVVPEVPGRVISSVVALNSGFATSFSRDGMPGVSLHDLDGTLRKEIASDEPGVFSGIKSDGDGNLRFSFSSLTTPRVDKLLDLKTGEISIVGELKLPGFNPADFVVERKWYTSTDGTRVPMSLAHKKGIKLDGSNPGFIYVYGGFGTAVAPNFSTGNVPFLEAGGVFAIAHVRGGSDLGEEWHNQAKGLGRKKVYDDVAEAARFLANAGYSSAEHLSVGGVSNGGLVSAVAATRDAKLFDAAVVGVGLTDMARYEQLGGSSWSQEYGSFEDPEQAKALISWSPYHNVHDNGKYPAMLIYTGKNDDRVRPAHSYKLAARLQDVETAAHPVYLRVDEGQGHGIAGGNEVWANNYADQWAFLLNELTDSDSRTPV